MSETAPGGLVGEVGARLAKGDAVGALELLDAAETRGSLGAELHLQRALALRLRGEFARALEAVDKCLVLEPYHFVALISKAALLERLVGPKAAAPIYTHALTIAPPEAGLGPGLRSAVERARRVVREDAEALERALLEATAEGRAQGSGPDLDRFEEALGVFAGTKKFYRQEPILLNYPGLPSIPFYDRALFPWLGRLEAATETIRGELENLLAQEHAGFAPYIQYPPGVPVNQWGELNYSRRWSSLFLWRDGRKEEEPCALCPKTAALLEGLPMMRQDGFAPTVTFSALQPKTHIPPHTGSSNTRLLVHLPLILPGPARFRVGNVTRSWRMGEAWVFDDTIEHEAWNDADALRVILIFDVWNPHLTERERELIGRMMRAKNQYRTS